MTPEYAATQLLALGPLSQEDFRMITGWNDWKIRGTILRLQRAGVVTVTANGNRGAYWLTRDLPQQLYEAGANGRMRLLDSRRPARSSALGRLRPVPPAIPRPSCPRPGP